MLCSCYADVLFKKEGKSCYLRNSNNKNYLSRLILSCLPDLTFQILSKNFLEISRIKIIKCPIPTYVRHQHYLWAKFVDHLMVTNRQFLSLSRYGKFGLDFNSSHRLVVKVKVLFIITSITFLTIFSIEAATGGVQ